MHLIFGSIAQAESQFSYFGRGTKAKKESKNRKLRDSPAEPSNPETKALRQSQGAMYSLWEKRREFDLSGSCHVLKLVGTTKWGVLGTAAHRAKGTHRNPNQTAFQN